MIRRRHPLFDVLGNAVAAFCCLASPLVFIAVMHLTQDSAQLAALLP